MLIFFYIPLAALLFFSFFSIVIWTLRNGISPMPSSPKAKAAIFQLIEEYVPKEMEGDIVELGSGFLTLALPIAKKFPHIKIIAYETSTLPYLISKIISFFFY